MVVLGSSPASGWRYDCATHYKFDRNPKSLAAQQLLSGRKFVAAFLPGATYSKA
jgi:hypothetical protein